MIRIGTVEDTLESGPEVVRTQVPRPRGPVGAGPSARPRTV